MPKSTRESKKVASAPYKKGGQAAKDQSKKSVIAHKQMNKKGMKHRNEALTDQIDNLFTAASTKKQKAKTKAVDPQQKAQQVEEAQKQYEKLQTDMDDALAQITKL